MSRWPLLREEVCISLVEKQLFHHTKVRDTLAAVVTHQRPTFIAGRPRKGRGVAQTHGAVFPVRDTLAAVVTHRGSAARAGAGVVLCPHAL